MMHLTVCIGLLVLILGCFATYSEGKKIEFVFDDTPQFTVVAAPDSNSLILTQCKGVGHTAFSLPASKLTLKPCKQFPDKHFLMELWFKNKAILVRNSNGSWHLDELIDNVRTYLIETNTSPLPTEHIQPLLMFTSTKTVGILSLLLGCRPVPKPTWFNSESILDPRTWRLLNLLTNNSETLLTFRSSNFPSSVTQGETVTVDSHYLTLTQDNTGVIFKLESTDFIDCDPVEAQMALNNAPLPQDFLSDPSPESWMQWGERQIERLPIPDTVKAVPKLAGNVYSTVRHPLASSQSLLTQTQPFISQTLKAVAAPRVTAGKLWQQAPSIMPSAISNIFHRKTQEQDQ